MSDLIERDKAVAVIDRCKHRLQGQGSTYEIMLDMIKTIPSAEPTWADALAELHERFDALEKELRRASAEMSAIIRKYVDRPKGEWKHLKGDEWLCSNCGYVVWTEGSWEHPLERGKDYCEHCGANMTMKGADDE